MTNWWFVILLLVLIVATTDSKAMEATKPNPCFNHYKYATLALNAPNAAAKAEAEKLMWNGLTDEDIKKMSKVIMTFHDSGEIREGRNELVATNTIYGRTVDAAIGFAACMQVM